jgi:chromosomal replication initiation ATPase DnaA
MTTSEQPVTTKEKPTKDTKAIADVLTPISWNDMPKDLWKCSVCGKMNRNYLPTMAAILGSDGPKWVAGACQHCEEKFRDEQAKTVEAEKKEERRSRVLALHNRAALPKEMAFIKFTDLKIRAGAEEAFTELANLNAEDRCWVCITGDNSVGKSRLLAATSNRQIGLLNPTLYLNESLFFKGVRESWDGDGEQKLMSIFKLPDIVLWDEFSFFNYLERSWIYERVYAILEQLAEMDKKVVFATNIMNVRKQKEDDPLSLEGRCGKRIWARLQRRQTKYIKMINEPYY